jgi:uncharacterized protein (TIGR01777 family)
VPIGPQRVVVTGSSGLIGTALVAALEAEGREAVGLRRGPQWQPEQALLDPAVLDGADAVVHLAGEGIGDHRWSDEHKRRVRDSRVNGTAALAAAIAQSPTVKVFVCGSAVGYYGDAGDRECTEDSPAGTGFLSEVVTAWEAAAAPAEAAARVVRLRTGIVLSPHGGALGKQLLPFRMGAGARLGDGRQWQSWVHIDDEVGAIRHALDHDEVAGPVNATAPNPVTNAEFTKALGRALRRPAVLTAPAFALRAMFGKGMADEMLLAGQRVLPAKLQATGYEFKHPNLDEALKELLG